MSHNRTLYVAEPIDQSDYGPWKESVASMVGIARRKGWVCFRPARAFDVGADTTPGPEIEGLNRAVLSLSGAIIAHLPSGVPSVGVPREVEFAIQRGIPALVATDKPGWSLVDVLRIDLGDTVGFAQWLAGVESEPPMSQLLFVADENGQLPTRSNEGDAGYDLYVSEDRVIPPSEFVDVPCGLRVALPPGVWGRITGRSSTLRKRQLMVAEGVIDNGYRGPLYSGVWNLGEHPTTVRRGERVAQLVLHDNVSARYEAAMVDPRGFDRIPGDGRGDAGFGSTGV